MPGCSRLPASLPRDSYFLDKYLPGVPPSIGKTAGGRQEAACSHRVYKVEVSGVGCQVSGKRNREAET
ncbi:MAG: hypothetical protein LJE87_05975 [Deltaproteobacteria bacterium]|nr:hypothetical protein [Deltaproteobacteria bacterium]